MSNDSRSILVVGLAALVLLCGTLGAVLAIVNTGDVSNTPVEDDTMTEYEGVMENVLVGEIVYWESMIQHNQVPMTGDSIDELKDETYSTFGSDELNAFPEFMNYEI